MHQKQKRRKKRPAQTGRQRMWFWTSQGLLVRQQAWLGMREYDKRQPACHYNLHIQPACGGQDYHNYHIRYQSARQGEHAWSVVDAPYGREKSYRLYTYSQKHSISEAIDVASSLLVTDITNDIGDPLLWCELLESLALVLLDLYRHEEKRSGRIEGRGTKKPGG